VTYHDDFDSLFWWYLLDQSIDVQAQWAYHHRYEMDAARYNSLLAQNAVLSSQVAQLEAQSALRDPNYAPPGFDTNVMYTSNPVAATPVSAPVSTPTYVPAYAPANVNSGHAAFNIFIWFAFAVLVVLVIWFIFIRQVKE
jgi:hypothetical protein